MLIAFALSFAYATELTPSSLLPSAAPAEAGTGEVAVGGQALAFTINGPAGAGSVGYIRGQVAVTDWLTLSGMGGGGALDGTFGQGFDTAEGVVVGGGAVSVRVLRGAHFNAGLFAGGGYGQSIAGTAAELGMVGVALEGGDRVRGDLSLPAVYIHVDGFDVGTQFSIIESVALAEAGVSWDLGDHDRLRIGKGLGPAVSAKWTHASNAWYSEVEVQAPVAIGLSVRAEIGHTF